MKRRGIPVYVWTVNDKKEIRKLFKKDISGIITDRPDIALKVRNEE